MSILTVGTPSLQGNLKLYYQKVREDVFPLITPLFAQFQKLKAGGPRNMRWGGKGAVFDVVVSDPVPGTFSSEGWLPEATSRTEVQATVNVARMYIRKRIDKLTVAATANRNGAFIPILQKIDEEVRDEMKLTIQQGLHGDARDIKAIVTAVPTTTTIDIASPYGVANAGQGALWIAQGGLYAITNAAGSTLRGRRTVTNVALQTAPDTYRITIDTALSGGDAVQVGDVIVGATLNDTARGAGINGLINLTNRGNNYALLHDINAATWARWDSVRMTAGTDTSRVDQLLETDLFELFMRIAARGGKSPLTDPSEFLVVTTPGLKKSYAESVQGQRQLTLAQTSRTLNGGYAVTAECNGVAIMDDPYCPVGTVYCIHLPSLGYVDAEDFKKVQFEGSDAWNQIAGRDAFETSFSMYFNIATTMRNAHGSITGFTDTFRYSPLAA
jgi:hypothetical protein